MLKTDAQASILILDVVGRGERAKVAFVQDRITGETNLWDRMTKVKYLNWDTLSKKVSMKGLTKYFQFRATTNFFGRLLVIAKSGQDIDLQQAISEYEFSNISPVLMKPDGKLHPCLSKSDLIHELESLVGNKECAQEVPLPISKRYLIPDEMVLSSNTNECSHFQHLQRSWEWICHLH